MRDVLARRSTGGRAARPPPWNRRPVPPAGARRRDNSGRSAAWVQSHRSRYGRRVTGLVQAVEPSGSRKPEDVARTVLLKLAATMQTVQSMTRIRAYGLAQGRSSAHAWSDYWSAPQGVSRPGGSHGGGDVHTVEDRADLVQRLTTSSTGSSSPAEARVAASGCAADLQASSWTGGPGGGPATMVAEALGMKVATVFVAQEHRCRRLLQVEIRKWKVQGLVRLTKHPAHYRSGKGERIK